VRVPYENGHNRRSQPLPATGGRRFSCPKCNCAKH
jgi:hypothetical protein